MRVLGTLLEGSGKYFAVCILLGLLLTVVEMIAPQVIRVTVDSVIDSQPMDLPAWALRWVESLGGVAFLRANMWFIALILALAGLVAALLRYGANMFNAKAGETLVKTARDRLFHHIECLPWKWHAEHPTGDIIQRCTSDVERIKNFFQEQFISVFQIIVRIILALTLMTLMNAKLSIVAWVIAPIIVLYSVLFHNKIRARFTECDENEGVLSTIAQENLTGVRVVRAFGREKFERDRFEAQNNKYTECWISLTRTLSDFWAVGDFTSCLQILLVVVLGTVSCVNGNLTAGEFVSFSLYNTMLIGPVRRLGRIISEMSKAGVSIDRLGEVLEAETEQDAPNAAEAPMDKDITFENVSFHYGEDGPDVLENVSFTVPAGKSFGILGGTGSGKSSLLLLLCRLYAPTEGKITVGGVDIADMPARYVRENVGVVLQEPFLFSRSVQENIGICGASDAEIRAAAVTACVDGDITRFSQGYDTMVGERGVSLSGGQKQRVAIARMLTKKTPVIVFDDSLSAVDTETDEKIRSALDRDLGGATTIIISHRITTLLDCDNILVLEKGRVSQLGSPKELLAQPGIFRKIYDMQMSIGEEERSMNEQKKTKGAKWFGIPNLVPYMRPYGKLIFWMVLMAFYGSAMDAVIPLFQQYAIDHYIADSTLAGLGWFIGAYVVVILTQTASNYISAFGACKLELSVGRDLKRESFNHLQTLSFSYFNQNSVGYVHARVMSDTDRIASTLAWSMAEGVWHSAYLVCAIVMMLILNWKMALCVLVIVPIVAISSHVLPEEARVLPPAGAREKLPHHRRLQRGHHRRDDDENARR